jgi:hypothetical protein
MNKLKIKSMWVAMIGLGAVGVWSLALAYDNSTGAQNVIQANVVNIYGTDSQNQTTGSEIIGAAANASNATHLSQDPIPSAIGGDSGVYVSGPQEIDGESYFDGSVYTYATTSNNGYETKVFNGSAADATTTLFCIKNPFGVTSTVRVSVQITGPSTSSVKLYVAPTSTSAGLAGLGTLDDNMLIEAAAINTSTVGYVKSGVTVGSPGIISSGAGTFYEVAVSKSNYVCGQITAEASVLGVTNPLNTFALTYNLIFQH